MKTLRVFLGCFVAFCLAVPVVADTVGKRSKLKEVLDRGVLNCGVRSGTVQKIPGDPFSDTGAQKIGELYCRGLAAALDVNVNIVKLSVAATFEGLNENSVDVTFRTASETLGRDVVDLANGVAIMYYENYTAKVKQIPITVGYPMEGSVPEQVSFIKDRGLRVCVREKQIQQQIGEGWGLKPCHKGLCPGPECDMIICADDEYLYITNTDSQAYKDGFCEVNMNGTSFHADITDPAASVPWGETPLLVMTSQKHSDPQWDDLIKYYMGGLRGAVRYGINKINVVSTKNTNKHKSHSALVPEAKALLGLTTNCRGETAGDLVGLDPDWMVRAIHKVGNYYEIYDASLGLSALGGLNKVTDDTGMNQVYFDANGRTNGLLTIHVHDPVFTNTNFVDCSIDD